MKKYEESSKEEEKQMAMEDDEINEFLVMDNKQQRLSNFVNNGWYLCRLRLKQ